MRLRWLDVINRAAHVVLFVLASAALVNALHLHSHRVSVGAGGRIDRTRVIASSQRRIALMQPDVSEDLFGAVEMTGINRIVMDRDIKASSVNASYYSQPIEVESCRRAEELDPLDAKHFITRARLGYKGRAWCAANTDKEPFIQVTFSGVKTIKRVVTQANACEQSWVTNITIKHAYDSRPAFQNWMTYNDALNIGSIQTVLDANTNNVDQVSHQIGIPFHAGAVRIYAKAWHGRACMRVGIYGDECTSCDQEGSFLETSAASSQPHNISGNPLPPDLSSLTPEQLKAKGFELDKWEDELEHWEADLTARELALREKLRKHHELHHREKLKEEAGKEEGPAGPPQAEPLPGEEERPAGAPHDELVEGGVFSSEGRIERETREEGLVPPGHKPGAPHPLPPEAISRQQNLLTAVHEYDSKIADLLQQKKAVLDAETALLANDTARARDFICSSLGGKVSIDNSTVQLASACCPASECDRCGGPGCEAYAGGKSQCCADSVAAEAKVCKKGEHMPPCRIDISAEVSRLRTESDRLTAELTEEENRRLRSTQELEGIMKAAIHGHPLPPPTGATGGNRTAGAGDEEQDRLRQEIEGERQRREMAAEGQGEG
ncbi:unnamed protein product [Vitrella brassicaformis CCMP3155]|uniref:F5/8 type C domain-containing protein n=1 Tax=Vitrella brassicaformis (strain CCMP3155) TaxID=1169540 RepID=A0A0G4EZN4_VITBC|nr:unnamed protein product [Vitrella brassicaformis CCMP3155]|eukprot:CEM04475.1 unnamed protein product [Vitrella brassicaformis CCMP3155]